MGENDTQNVGVVQGAMNYIKPKNNVFAQSANGGVGQPYAAQPNAMQGAADLMRGNIVTKEPVQQDPNPIGPSTIQNQEAPKALPNDPNQKVVVPDAFGQNNADTRDWVNPMNRSGANASANNSGNIPVQKQTVEAPKFQKPEQTQKEPTSWQELRDQLYGSEAERERKANNNAKVLAVGDALRHIGNLATTAWGHATPQQYKTSPAQDTLDTYKTEREQRDAKAYTYWNNLQQQKMKELENEQKAQAQAYNQYDKDRTFELKAYQQKYKEGQDQFNNDMAMDKRAMEKQMQDFNIKIGTDKNDRENKKTLEYIKHLNNQDAVAFGNLSLRQQEHYARVAGIGGYSGSGNTGGVKRMQSYFGILEHQGKTDLSDEQISSIYSFAKQRGWLNGTDAEAFKGLVMSKDGDVSKHAMISAVTSALADNNNKSKEALASYLIQNWGFKPTTESGKIHYQRAMKNKRFNLNR